MEATAPKAKFNDRDAAIYEVHRAAKFGTPEQQQAAMENLAKVAQGETMQKISMASSFDELGNIIWQATGQNVDYQQGDDGTIKVGDQTFRDLKEAKAYVTGIVAKNPMLALEYDFKRNADDRQATTMKANLANMAQDNALQREQLQLQRDIESRHADEQEVTLAPKRRQLAMLNEVDRMTKKDGDAFLYADDLAQLAREMSADDTDMKVVKNEDGTTTLVGKSPRAEQIAAEINAKTAEFRASPWTIPGRPGAGTIQREVIGGRPYYTVRGVEKQGFTNFHAAEAAARRLYPNVLKQAAQPKAK